jgi:hypothetical protein
MADPHWGPVGDQLMTPFHRFNKNRMHSTDKPISRTFADQFYVRLLTWPI